MCILALEFIGTKLLNECLSKKKLFNPHVLYNSWFPFHCSVITFKHCINISMLVTAGERCSSAHQAVVARWCRSLLSEPHVDRDP